MSKWISKFTCPRFMVIPWKPWLFGNKYHMICFSETDILFVCELVEGKDDPNEASPKKHSEKGKTVGLCLRLTKSMHGTGNGAVMDSEFCVLDAIVQLKKCGVFSLALVKKRQYWQKYLKGEEVKQHFDNMDPGYFDAIGRTLDRMPSYIYEMKEPDYVLLFMTTFGLTT